MKIDKATATFLKVASMGFWAIWGSALADCWGTVAYAYTDQNGAIQTGINPLPGNTCECPALNSTGAIGHNAVMYSFLSSAANKNQTYAALLLATSNGTAVYVQASSSSPCAGVDVISYAQ